MNSNDIHPKILKEIHDIIVGPSIDIFNQFLQTGEVPYECPTARIVPIRKKDRKEKLRSPSQRV